MSEPLPRQPDAEARALTIEEAVQLAIGLQRTGRLSEADLVYKRILDAAPTHPAALHFSGVLAHQLGLSAEALSRIDQSLAMVPDQADWHNNRGIVLQSVGRLDEALAAHDRAIELNPAHASAYSNRGILLRATGRIAEAESSYRHALELDATHLDAWTNLGILLNSLKRTEEAVSCYCKVILLRPEHQEARRLLALAHCTLGEVDQAIDIYERWLIEEPGDDVAAHMLAACSGRAVPARASDGFVARTFDGFAASFESKLEQLQYRAPRLIAAMIEDAGLVADRSLDVLDAGCGTGLCAPLLAPYARTLAGVDLSTGMLQRASEKRFGDAPAYDSLVHAELTSYLRDHRAAFDLVISADTLCYFGALEEVIVAAAGALRPGGLLVFTVEHAADANTAPGYRLEHHGRYSHARDYVERVLAEAAFRSEIVSSELRMEAGVPVPGLVVRAVKPM